MANNSNIYKKCNFCGGDGIIEGSKPVNGGGETESNECHKCNGEGEVYWGQMKKQ